jgi:hypothetical protein
MSCPGTGIECDTVQIIEPNTDLLVDTAGANSDIDEHGEVLLNQGQTGVIVYFVVPKLNANYSFEYLYVEAANPPQSHPGTVIPIPTIKLNIGFGIRLAGSPIAPGYVLKWRVTIKRTSSLVQIDAPENLYLQMPRTTTMQVVFANPRGGVDYGFSELRVENLIDTTRRALIHVQVYQKGLNGFFLDVNPRPPTDHYFLKVRTP